MQRKDLKSVGGMANLRQKRECTQPSPPWTLEGNVSRKECWFKSGQCSSLWTC